MAGRGGCFKRQSPLANQAALVEAASARLGSAEPRVVPCAAQTSEQYRYVAAARACHQRRCYRRSARTTFQTAPAPARSATGSPPSPPGAFPAPSTFSLPEWQ